MMAPTSKRTAPRDSTKTAPKRPPAASKASKPTKKPRTKAAAEDPETWTLRLYVTGQTPKSVEAFANLKRICEEHLSGRYMLEVVDLLREPALARGDQILAVPTLVRRLPQPVKKLIGDLSNTERVLVGLNLRPYKLRDAGE